MKNMNYTFKYDARLGIHLPLLNKVWEEYTVEEQEQILLEWEAKRADIPGRIKELEKIIEGKQAQLNNEANFKRACELNYEIAEVAKTINDLNIWFRIQQETEAKMHT